MGELLRMAQHHAKHAATLEQRRAAETLTDDLSSAFGGDNPAARFQPLRSQEELDDDNRGGMMLGRVIIGAAMVALGLVLWGMWG